MKKILIAILLAFSIKNSEAMKRSHKQISDNSTKQEKNQTPTTSTRFIQSLEEKSAQVIYKNLLNSPSIKHFEKQMQVIIDAPALAILETFKDKILNKKLDFTGTTLAHQAVKKRDLIMLEILKKLGACLYFPDINGVTPYWLCAAGFPEGLNVFDEEVYVPKATDSYNEVEIAIIMNQPVAVSYLLNKNINSLSSINNLIDNLVFLAARYSPACLEVLSKHPKFNINAALYTAINYHNIESVKFLIKSGANLEVRDHENMTPLIRAAQVDFFEGFKLLLESGSDFKARDEENNTAMYYVPYDKSGILYLELLKKYDANILLDKTYNNETMLTHIFEYEITGCLEMFEYLLNNGLDVNASNNDGVTAVDSISAAILSYNEYDFKKYGNELLAILKLFMDNEGIIKNINRVDYQGNTLLIRAIQSNDLALVQKLLQAGANPYIENNENKNALDFAKKSNALSQIISALQDAMDEKIESYFV